MLTSSELDPLHFVTVDFEGQSRQTDTLEKIHWCQKYVRVNSH